MFCSKCGKSLSEGATVCEHCGAEIAATSPKSEDAEVTPTPIEIPEEQEPVAPQAAPTEPDEPSVQEEAPAKPVKPKKAKKSKKGLIALLIVLVLLLGTIGVVASMLFPLDVTMEDPTVTKTKTGLISNSEIAIGSNQPILSVRYALSANTKPKDDAYQDATCEGGLFDKTVVLNDFRINPGKTKLYVKVKTLFGEYSEDFDLSCNIGKLTVPSYENIVSLSETTKVASEELLITFKNNVSEKDANDKIAGWGGKVIGSIYVLKLYQTKFEGMDLNDLADLIETIKQDEAVLAVSYNTVYSDALTPMALPNDSEYDSWDAAAPYGNNWHLECIDAPGAWDHRQLLKTTPVGILDSTLFYDHEDIQTSSSKYIYLGTESLPTAKDYNNALLRHKESCYNSYCDFCDMLDHGTHVAGIVGAIENNQKGVCGVAWNSDLYFSNGWAWNSDASFAYGSTSAYLYSITYMAMSGCRVINMSLGSAKASVPGGADEIAEGAMIEETFKKLENAGYDFLIVKAAGNSDDDADNYRINRMLKAGETARKHVIIVGALENNSFELGESDSSLSIQYSMAYYSNFGDIVDIAAPGSYIYSTINSGYHFLSGTSMATPVVSGVATMIYGANPALTAPEVKDILTNNVNAYSAKGGLTYPIVNAHLAVEAALNITEQTAVQKPTAGFVTGVVQDAQSGNQINDGVYVIATNNATNERIVADIMPNGEYYFYAEAGTYTLQFHATNYISETIYGVKVETGIVKYNIRLNMVPPSDENVTGSVSGYVIDAFDASRIPNATIAIYRGVDNTSGQIIANAVSDYDGKYSFELEPGNYTAYITANGYTPGTTNLLVVGGESKNDQNCALTPILNVGEIRAVLTWGQYPLDLDSHLVGPSAGGGRFHIYYQAQNYYYNGTLYNNLDVDDTTSYGPETTSVYIGVPGDNYTFYVHDFSNRERSQSNSLATSGATVKVYVGGVDTPYVFNVPAENGTLWEVFSIKDGVLTPSNVMSYESSPSDVGE